MSPSRTTHRTAASLTAALLLVASPALAQQPGAGLRKSDLVRYLTGSAYSKNEIAGIVLRNCLAFTPSARDRRDLRALGATDAVFRAIDRCASAHNDPAALAKATPPAPPQPVTIQPDKTAISADAGSVAYISATLTRGQTPIPGVRLYIRGATRIPGGPSTDPTAVTDNSGIATFTIPAGTRSGQYRLSIDAANELGAEAQFVTLTTASAAAARINVTPAVLSIGPGMGSSWALDAAVTDGFGNPAPAVEVTVIPPERLHLSPLSRRTTEGGAAQFAIPTTGFRDGDTISIAVAGQVRVRVPVSASAQVAARVLEAERLAAAQQPGALAAYDSVLAIDPGNVTALLGRGYLRSRAGKYDEARADFQAVLQYGGDAVAAEAGLGFAALRIGDYAAAEAAFARALTASPRDGAAATGQAYTALWRRDRDQASRRAESLETPKPATYGADAAERFRAGVLSLSVRRLPDAINAFTAAVTYAPSWAEAYYNRALALQANGQVERAAQDYRRFLQLRPSASDAVQLSRRIDALGRSPGKAFALGLIPGMGQFYTKQPALGVLVLAATAGSAVWALQSSNTTELQTFKDPFGNTYTQPVTVSKRRNLATGAAIGGAVWLIGAIEGAVHASGARSAPALPSATGAGSDARRTASIAPAVLMGPSGTRLGVEVAVAFR